MEGKAIIQLFDNESGNLIHEQEDHNLVTNIFSKIFDMAYKGKDFKNYWLSRDIANGLEQTVFADLLGGILIFSEPLQLNADLFYTSQKPMGYAGSLYSGNDPKRGTINASETVPITNVKGETIGMKYVYDFPTNACNGTISSVALTTLAGGDNTTTTTTTTTAFAVLPASYRYSNSVIFNYNPINGTSYNRIFFDDDLIVYASVTDGVLRKYINTAPTVSFNVPLISLSNNMYIEKIYPYTYPTNFIYFKNYMYFVGKNSSSLKYELVKVRTSDLEIESTTELTAMSDTNKFSNQIGLCGNCIYSGLSSTGSGSYTHTINVYDITTHTYTAGKILATGIATSAGYSNEIYRMVETENGTNILIIGTISIGQYSSHFIYPDGTSEIITSSSSTPKNSLGNTPILSANMNYPNSLNYFSTRPISLLGRTLVTINNLSSPIVKTNQNTMKITYEIKLQ